MKKRNILTLIATLTLTAGMLTGCGTELTAASVEVEVGTEVSDNVLDYITIEKGDMERIENWNMNMRFQCSERVSRLF